MISIEIARRWSRRGANVEILTTSAGRNLCQKMGLGAVYHVTETDSRPTIFGELRTLWASLMFLRSSPFEMAKFDIVCTSSEHMYDVVPALLLKRDGVARSWIATVHFLPPRPLMRARAGVVRSLLYYLNHSTGVRLIRIGADLVFAVSERTGRDYVDQARFDPKRVMVIPGGIDMELIRRVARSVTSKDFDAIFMKRLDPMKGSYDLVEIWKRVTKARTHAKLIVVGAARSDVRRRVEHAVARYGIERNFEMIGPVYDQKTKIELLARSRVLVLPSLEENWALVIGEALAAGIPVVAYDLPEIREVWGSHVRWIEKGNTSAFADAVVEIISKHPEMASVPRSLERFEWERIAEQTWIRSLDLVSRMDARRR